jgi:flagellar basal-body rod modification protein FlgD
VVSATGTTPTDPSAIAAKPGGVAGSSTLAGNFDTFLRLLTTQLQNQNPLDPLDTNQFTQQLVQFASVEQQVNMNSNLTTLIAMQKTAQTTSALGFLGTTVTVDGNTANLASGHASWSFNAPKPSTATITITAATGQTAYSSAFPLSAGTQNFMWDGRGNDGTPWPDGAYTMTITAQDASGQSVAISTEVQGTVDGIDVTQNPPVLTVGGQSFTIDKIKQINRTS